MRPHNVYDRFVVTVMLLIHIALPCKLFGTSWCKWVFQEISADLHEQKSTVDEKLHKRQSDRWGFLDLPLMPTKYKLQEGAKAISGAVLRTLFAPTFAFWDLHYLLVQHFSITRPWRLGLAPYEAWKKNFWPLVFYSMGTALNIAPGYLVLGSQFNTLEDWQVQQGYTVPLEEDEVVVFLNNESDDIDLKLIEEIKKQYVSRRGAKPSQLIFIRTRNPLEAFEKLGYQRTKGRIREINIVAHGNEGLISFGNGPGGLFASDKDKLDSTILELARKITSKWPPDLISDHLRINFFSCSSGRGVKGHTFMYTAGQILGQGRQVEVNASTRTLYMRYFPMFSREHALTEIKNGNLWGLWQRHAGIPGLFILYPNKSLIPGEDHFLLGKEVEPKIKRVTLPQSDPN